MIHLGDITKISGYDVPITDIVCGGSPCQDLSVAGKRAGLAGERSGLFMEQVRIIKEMREHDRSTNEHMGVAGNTRPRFCIWENVPGAFSSNKGEDFRAVLEEFARVSDEDAVIPGPPGGKWEKCGAIVGKGYSIAWRLHDAQYWGVPQRRKRICVLCDFNGDAAPAILFELQRETTDGSPIETIRDTGNETGCEVQSFSESVSGHTEPGGTQGESITGSTEERTGSTEQGTLNGWDIQSKHVVGADGVAEPLYSGECRGGGGESYVLDGSAGFYGDMGASAHGIGYKEEQAHTLAATAFTHCLSFQERAGKPGGEKGILIQNEKTASIRTQNNQMVYGISPYASHAMLSDNPKSGIYEAKTARTLDLNGGSPACNQGGMCVVEGNGSRPSHMGDGYAESETMYTLNSTEQHAVCYRKGSHPRNNEEGQTWKKTHTHDTLNAFDNGESRTPVLVLENHPNDSRIKIKEDGVFQALSSRMGTGGNNTPMVMEQRSYQDVTGPLMASGYSKLGTQEAASDMYVVQKTFSFQGFADYKESDEGSSCKQRDYKDATDLVVSYGLDRASYNQGKNAQYDFSVEEELAPPIIAKGPGGTNGQTVGAICYRDYKGVGNQYVSEGKCIIQYKG